MDALFEIDDHDALEARVGGHGRRRRRVAELTPDAASGLRFAFYGRTSTAEYQDPVTSRAWQRDVAESVIAGRGEITVEFMDVGWSREVAWARRPQAAALLVAARHPRRSFDAVVVGEYERGFTARQFLRVAEQLGQHGVRVWLPEADGPVDPGDPTHRALVTLLGAHAKAGGRAGAASDVGGDAGPDGGAGPIPWWSSAVWISAGGCGAASE